MQIKKLINLFNSSKTNYLVLVLISILAISVIVNINLLKGRNHLISKIDQYSVEDSNYAEYEDNEIIDYEELTNNNGPVYTLNKVGDYASAISRLTGYQEGDVSGNLLIKSGNIYLRDSKGVLRKITNGIYEGKIYDASSMEYGDGFVYTNAHILSDNNSVIMQQRGNFTTGAGFSQKVVIYDIKNNKYKVVENAVYSISKSGNLVLISSNTMDKLAGSDCYSYIFNFNKKETCLSTKLGNEDIYPVSALDVGIMSIVLDENYILSTTMSTNDDAEKSYLILYSNKGEIKKSINIDKINHIYSFDYLYNNAESYTLYYGDCTIEDNSTICKNRISINKKDLAIKFD